MRPGRLLPMPVKRRLAEFLPLWHRSTSAHRVLPDFLIIGGQRCGSTSLFSYLSQHPRIVPSYKKEVHYFDLHFDRGSDWYRSHFPLQARADFEQRLDRPPRTGEATPYYIFHPQVPARVADLLPKVKLIALLRNPVHRALSHYHHHRRKKYEFLSFEEALDAEEERLDGAEQRLVGDDGYSFNHHRYSYLARGRYAEQLERWWQHFDRNQFFIARSEDFYAEPSSIIADICQFLEVPTWTPGRFEVRGRANYPALTPHLHDRLQSYFEPHNQRLEGLLHRRFWR